MKHKQNVDLNLHLEEYDIEFNLISRKHWTHSKEHDLQIVIPE